MINLFKKLENFCFAELHDFDIQIHNCEEQFLGLLHYPSLRKVWYPSVFLGPRELMYGMDPIRNDD